MYACALCLSLKYMERRILYLPYNYQTSYGCYERVRLIEVSTQNWKLETILALSACVFKLVKPDGLG